MENIAHIFVYVMSSYISSYTLRKRLSRVMLEKIDIFIYCLKLMNIIQKNRLV